MTSLIFRALDQHVVFGNADAIAIDDGVRPVTYAELLGQTAAIAGGFAQIGVEQGARIALDLTGTSRIVAVLALARVGAIPDADASFRIAGEPPIVHTGEFEYAWATVVSAGKTDPLPAPDTDEPGYAELLNAAYEDIFATLVSGGTIG